MSSHLNDIQNWPELAHKTKWSVSAMAKKCGVSVSTLERHFIMKIGKNPKAWLIETRRREAFKLLQAGSTVKEVACCLDYKHQNHLTNDFKRRWGICPTDEMETNCQRTVKTSQSGSNQNQPI